jgi:hypothetical protein
MATKKKKNQNKKKQFNNLDYLLFITNNKIFDYKSK